ncbi:MAG: hypothetical protein ACR2HE_05325 [Casimicrobiaceae bacterium]
MNKPKSAINFPTPKGKKGQALPVQDARRRPPAVMPRVIPRTKASPKGR